MAFLVRFGVYVVGGGILLAWADLPGGPLRWIVVLACILAMAYVDHGVNLPRRVRPSGSRVVKLDAFRASRHKRGQSPPGKSERRTPRPIFSTAARSEVEALLAALRGKGLNPIMVTQKSAGADSPVMYEVRLPEPEVQFAKSLIAQHLTRFPASRG